MDGHAGKKSKILCNTWIALRKYGSLSLLNMSLLWFKTVPQTVSWSPTPLVSDFEGSCERQSWFWAPLLCFSWGKCILWRRHCELCFTERSVHGHLTAEDASDCATVTWAPGFTAAAATRLLIRLNCEGSFCVLDTCPLGTGLRPPTHFPQVTEQLSDGIIWLSSFGAACRSFLKHYVRHNVHD